MTNLIITILSTTAIVVVFDFILFYLNSNEKTIRIQKGIFLILLGGLIITLGPKVVNINTGIDSYVDISAFFIIFYGVSLLIKVGFMRFIPVLCFIAAMMGYQTGYIKNGVIGTDNSEILLLPLIYSGIFVFFISAKLKYREVRRTRIEENMI